MALSPRHKCGACCKICTIHIYSVIRQVIVKILPLVFSAVYSINSYFLTAETQKQRAELTTRSLVISTIEIH